MKTYMKDSPNWVSLGGNISNKIDHYFNQSVKIIEINKKSLGKDGKYIMKHDGVAQVTGHKNKGVGVYASSYQLYVLLIFGIIDETDALKITSNEKFSSTGKDSLADQNMTIKLRYTSEYTDFDSYINNNIEHVRERIELISNIRNKIGIQTRKLVLLAKEYLKHPKPFNNLQAKKRHLPYYKFINLVFGNDISIFYQSNTNKRPLPKEKEVKINPWLLRVEKLIEQYREDFRKNISADTDKNNWLECSDYPICQKAHIWEVKTIKEEAIDLENKEFDNDTLKEIANPDNGIIIEPNVHVLWDAKKLVLNTRGEFISDNGEVIYKLKSEFMTKERICFINKRNTH